MMEWTEPSFKLTSKEILSSAAITLCLLNLEAANFPTFSVKETCFKPQYGFTASASNIPIGPHFLRITDIKEGTVDWKSVPFCECNDPDKYQLAKGDILVARTGSVGKTFLISDVPEKVVFASYLIRLPVKPNVNPEYLYWCFQSQQFWNQIMGMRRGSAIKNINAKMLQSFSFPYPSPEMQEGIVRFLDVFQQRLDGVEINLPELPPPLEEQRRVIARIESLAAKVEAARKLREQAVAKTAILWGMAAEQVISSNNNWDAVTVEKISEVRGGIQKSKARIPRDNPRRYLTVAHVQRNWIDFSDPRYFEVSDEELVRWRLQKGDVLVVEGNGSIEQVGRAALFGEEIEDYVHQNHLIRVRPDPKRIVPEYLNLYLNSPIGRAQMIKRGRTTSGLYNLSVGRIKSIEVVLPSIPEQRCIVAYLDALQAKVAAVQQHQAATQVRLKALMPAILDQAFRGEL